MSRPVDLTPIHEFLPCPTPERWVARALEEMPILLIDHANCEKKAASTALNLMYRYVDYPQLLRKMSRLAREELRHFEQVLELMEDQSVVYSQLSASRYAGGLHANVRKTEPGRLVDTLLVGAIIEARSCERFAALVPQLEQKIAEFYQSLLKSESRHFTDYLKLAERVASSEEVENRLAVLMELEQELIEGPDPQFRFHSGVPE